MNFLPHGKLDKAKGKKLENEISIVKKKEAEVKDRNRSFEQKVKQKSKELEELKPRYQNLTSTLKLKKQTLNKLKKEVLAYKENKEDEIRTIYKNKYYAYIEEIRELYFGYSYNAFKKYDQAYELLKKIEFYNLRSKFYKFLNGKKEELRNNIIKSLNDKIFDQRKTHEFIFYLRFLVKYESYFKESIFVDFIYDHIYDGFEYHFMSDRSTNRLDKPEWMFEYLLKKEVDVKKYFDVYKEIQESENKVSKRKIDNIGNNDQVELLSCTTFDDLLIRINTIIQIKISEMENIESTQKRKLFLKFGTFLINYLDSVKEKFGASLRFDKFGGMLSDIQRKYILRPLEDHENMPCDKWFEIYKEIFREVIIFEYNYRSLMTKSILPYVTNKIVGYITVFVDNLRYIRREEIKILCFLYTQIEHLKEYVCEQENEILAGAMAISDTRNIVGKNILSQHITESLDAISKFNIENLKLIKTILSNDMKNLLRSLSNFKYATTSVIRNFIIELQKIIDDYTKCVAYKSLLAFCKVEIDKYFVEDILYNYKFSDEELAEFKDLFNRVKDVIPGNAWRTDKVLCCIENIFDGDTNIGDEYSRLRYMYM